MGTYNSVTGEIKYLPFTITSCKLMTETIIYKGLYKDRYGTLEIDVKNDFKTLSMKIDGVEFCGSEFSDMAIVNKPHYSDEQLKRFTFHSIRVYQTNIVLELLCNCSFEIVIQVQEIYCCDKFEIRKYGAGYRG
jgi:hypothetical protein